ncbi:DUF2249 domain-containing protein [Dyella jiangningensis]|uniref:DUF2249 domain-containing protein n=1 Tax=Dyella jiangningensis TaxID=1379159 RepID=A0A328P8Y6_9GAMM|nr:DUF2249 domain-containing protein [Dyella jiangningensis]RAO76936.1 hypothetical protein CA260_03215 [Dyella jiangningensis]
MNTSTHTCHCRDAVRPAATALLDLRSLQPPEPMRQALAAADRLAPGEVLEVLTPLMPMPLLSALAERGFQAQATMLPEGGARVAIRCIPQWASTSHGPTGA